MSVDDVRSLKGLKLADLQPCAICHKGMMHAGGVSFFKMRIERCIVDIPAVRRAQGMEMMMGGNSSLAHAMGPDSDLAKIMPDPTDVLICDRCALDRDVCIAVIAERHQSK